MDKQPTIKIYISCHKKSVLPKNALFVPVQGGAICAKEILPGMQRDDAGDNISLKNPMYCELTTQYWAWKNDEADYYGFCHYRRYFSFSAEKLPEDNYSTVLYSCLSDKAMHELSLNDEAQIRTVVEPYDLIITAPDNLKRHGRKNAYEQYLSTRHLNGGDMLCAIAVLKELYPEYAVAADKNMNGTAFYPCNMFIMKRELFRTYSEWLFSILFETERRLDMENYSSEGVRTLGHIGERLLGIFYTHIRENHPEYKTAVVQRAFVENTQPMEPPAPYFSERNIPIFFACSDMFVPYFSAMLISLIEHTSEENNYDLILLHTDIQTQNQKMLGEMVSERQNISLRFVNVSSLVGCRKWKANSHISTYSFYRLTVNMVFAAYDKIVWLDADMIVKRDVAELYRVDMGDNLLAAAADPDFIGEYCGAVPRVKKYANEELGIKAPFSYFQAGVLIFNVCQFRKTFQDDELLDFAESREFLYADQDVLNVKCTGCVHFLDMRWNVLTDNAGSRISAIISYAPKRVYDAYLESRQDPYIIHYAGDRKPWIDPSSDFAMDFWENAKKTPYYEVMLHRMVFGEPERTNGYRSGIRKLADKLIPKGTRRREFAKKILPRDSHRWNFIKKIYYFIFRR